MKMELRFNESKFDTNEDGSMTVSGYVNLTETRSNLLGGNQKFYEVIKRGAWKKAINQASDIHFLAEHDSTKILASTRNNSLKLVEDDRGLYMTATISPTSYGSDNYQLIKDGILRNMSFGFRSIKDSWRKVGDKLIRTVEELKLFEVSVVRDPAYSDSTISARGIDLIEDINIPTDIEEETISDDSEIRNTNTINMNGEVTMIEVLSENKQDKDFELRAMKQFLQGRFYEDEIRAVTTGTTPGSLSVPTNISEEIVQKLLETGELLGRAKLFPSASGYLEVLREATLGDAGFIGEMNSINPLDYTMDKVKLEQKRVGTALEISQNLINDAGFDITSYVSDLLVRRIATVVDRAIISGDASTGSFEGILTATLPAECKLTSAVSGSLSADDLVDMFNSMHPSLIEDAVFIMNRATFSTVSKLKDGENRYFLTSIKEGGSAKDHYKILGLPVIISDAMPAMATGAKSVILANLSEAVAVMIKHGMNLKKIDADTTQALRGSSLFVADLYADAKVLNTQALRVLTIKA